MPAIWNDQTKELHIHNDSISYIMRVLENGSIGQLYFGPRLNPAHSYIRHGRGAFTGFSTVAAEQVRLEYPVGGTGDFRLPAFVVEHQDGSTVLEPKYLSHRIFAGKTALPGLPATYVETASEADTVEIDLRDEISGIDLRLSYTIFRDFRVIARHVVFTNMGTDSCTLRCVMSASLDLPDSDWSMLHFSGAWARERHPKLRALGQGVQGFGSTRGASGHHHNPFMILGREWTTEENGEAYGFALVYSGNFLSETEVDAYGSSRVRIGISPAGFAWRLSPGETFHSPEALLAYADSGFGQLSETFHNLFRTRLARGFWRDKPRPVLLNNWEGTYFNFTQDRLLPMAAAAKKLGVELFVLDDGWFGRRDDDKSSLGDWDVNIKKLPDGIRGLAEKIESMGLRFGLWIEPEMVSPDSKLFAQHPDWVVGIPGRPKTLGRNQLVLDMSKPEVVDHLYGVFSGLLKSARISYIKWDRNRNITEPYGSSLPPERQGEFFHRFIRGVYELYERLIRDFPEVLFESCAGGGGRFDPGMLYYAPQAWTSDNTDAVERLKIQWGSSFAYPLSSMGAHVSEVPNHQVGRVTPLTTRAAVAFFGVFGYELDPLRLKPGEKKEIANQVSFYKHWRDLIRTGRFLRLKSPFDNDTAAWMVVSADGSRALVGLYRILNRAVSGFARLRLRGLDPSADYTVSTWPPRQTALHRENTGLRHGDELMSAGLLLGGDSFTYGSDESDFQATIFVCSSHLGRFRASGF